MVKIDLQSGSNQLYFPASDLMTYWGLGDLIQTNMVEADAEFPDPHFAEMGDYGSDARLRAQIKEAEGKLNKIPVYNFRLFYNYSR